MTVSTSSVIKGFEKVKEYYEIGGPTRGSVEISK